MSFRLDLAPEGMKVSDKGVLRWSVPKTGSAKEASVIVAVKDKSGQEVYHNFTLRVRD